MGLQLTRGGEYGIRAMVYLAQFPSARCRRCATWAALRTSLRASWPRSSRALVHADLAASQRGARGGFSLARPAADINVRQVIEAIDGPVLAQRLRAVARRVPAQQGLSHAQGVGNGRKSR